MKESKRDGSADALGQAGKDAGKEGQSTWKARQECPRNIQHNSHRVLGISQAEDETVWNGAVRGTRETLWKET